ncbi:MAG: sensor histidine kinase, partial [Bacteroidia bacterium]
VLGEMDEEIKKKKAKILLDKLPTLIVNPGLIRSLFHNLINNALKYSKKTISPIIRITSEISNAAGEETKDSQRRYARILVIDNGIGFPQKHAEQIFSIFKRLHANPEFEGAGIGLAICKKIVEQHRGFISAKSKEEEGSIFIVSLPMSLNPDEEKILPERAFSSQ